MKPRTELPSGGCELASSLYHSLLKVLDYVFRDPRPKVYRGLFGSNSNNE
jgi:hypothetical protein